MNKKEREKQITKYLDGKEVEAKVENESDVFEVLKEVGGYFKIDNPKDVLKVKNTRTSADFTYYRLSQKYTVIKK